MSEEDLDRQLSTALLDRVINHTLGKLDQVIRDREEATPEVEFDYALPPHSYKFECKQVAAWFHANELDLLRKTIYSTSYWAAEVRALLTALLDQIEIWASENAKPPAYWQQVIGSLHRLGGELGLSPEKLHEIREQITDDQYWRCEAELLKRHRALKDYEASSRQPPSASSPTTPTTRRQPSQKAQAPEAMLEQPIRTLRSRAQKAPTGRGRARTQQQSQSSVMGARVTKPSTDTKTPTLRRSARLEDKARTRAGRGQRAERIAG